MQEVVVDEDAVPIAAGGVGPVRIGARGRHPSRVHAAHERVAGGGGGDAAGVAEHPVIVARLVGVVAAAGADDGGRVVREARVRGALAADDDDLARVQAEHGAFVGDPTHGEGTVEAVGVGVEDAVGETDPVGVDAAEVERLLATCARIDAREGERQRVELVEVGAEARELERDAVGVVQRDDRVERDPQRVLVVDDAPALRVAEHRRGELHRGGLRVLAASRGPPDARELVRLVGRAHPVAAAVVQHARLPMQDACVVFLAQVARAGGVADAAPARHAGTVGERFGRAREPRVGGTGGLAACAGGLELALVEPVEVAHQQPRRPAHGPVVAGIVAAAVGEGAGRGDGTRALVDEGLVRAHRRRHERRPARQVGDGRLEDEAELVGRVAPFGEGRRVGGREAVGAGEVDDVAVARGAGAVVELAEQLEVLVRQLERDRKVGAEAAVVGVGQHAKGAQRDVAVVLRGRGRGEDSVARVVRGDRSPRAEVTGGIGEGQLGPAGREEVGVGPDLEAGPGGRAHAAKRLLTRAAGGRVEVAFVPGGRRGGVGLVEVDLGLDAFIARPPSVVALRGVVGARSGQRQGRDLDAAIAGRRFRDRPVAQ